MHMSDTLWAWMCVANSAQKVIPNSSPHPDHACAYVHLQNYEIKVESWKTACQVYVSGFIDAEGYFGARMKICKAGRLHEPKVHTDFSIGQKDFISNICVNVSMLFHTPVGTDELARVNFKFLCMHCQSLLCLISSTANARTRKLCNGRQMCKSTINMQRIEKLSQ